MTIKKTDRLGIVYSEESGMGLTHPYFVLIIDAFKREAERQGLEVAFINSSVISEGFGYADYCAANSIDGACIVCEEFDSQRIIDLARSSVPCLTIDHLFRHVPAILSDNETGVKKLVETAIKKGHRRIAFVHGHNNSIVTRARISQFRNTMAVHSIPIPPEYIQPGLYNNVPLTRKLVRRLLDLPERPTCILLPEDISYFAAQDAAREYGLRIPDDISFAGYDGIPLTQALSPKLTTIRQDGALIGTMAARRLIEMIRTPESASRLPVILPVEFLEGGTMSVLR